MLSIILPTLGNRIPELRRLFDSLDNQIDTNFEVICVVQDNYKDVKNLIEDYCFVIKTIVVDKRGLSKSRNKGLEYISGNSSITTFSDDDCWYPDYMVDKILSLHRKQPNNCFSFQIFDPIIELYYKDYSEKYIRNITKRQSLRISSIEFFVPSTYVKHFKFNEDFGLGSRYPSGEENIYLFDLLKSRKVISYYPEIIVFHKKPIWEDKYYIFRGKGALFSKLYSRPVAFLMVLIYAFRKYKFSKDIKEQLLGMIYEILNYKKS